MFITKKHLPRRTFLRGMGVSIALPLLDSMVAAQTPLVKTAARPTPRFSFIYIPHGSLMDRWTPASDAPNFELTSILKPLEGVREKLVVVTNTAIKAPNMHLYCNSMWLNGVKPKGTNSDSVSSAVTIDQMIAEKHGQDTTFPSLELALDDFSSAVGNCESVSCTYFNTLAWRTPTTPLPMEMNPRVVFERLFGDGSSAAERTARRQDSMTILDHVIQDSKRLQSGLGAHDRTRIDEYLDNVREIERRIQKADKQLSSQLAVPDAPAGIPESWEEHARIMYDLQVLAFQGDITRVTTMMVARELSQQAYPWIGVPDPHHTVSHHQNDPVLMDEHEKINTYHVKIFADFLEKLRSIKDGDGTLLDHSLIVYGSGMSNGNGHTHDPLPMLVAGGATGRLKGNRHLKLPAGTNLSNLLVSLLEKAGIEKESIGDSNGKVDL